MRGSSFNICNKFGISTMNPTEWLVKSFAWIAGIVGDIRKGVHRASGTPRRHLGL